MAMRRMAVVLAVVATGLMWTSSARAGETFEKSIQKGEVLERSGNFKQAVVEFTTAEGQGANNTEKAIARGKIAHAQAFGLKDYPAAKVSAEAALALTDVHPVGQVTALMALAEVQIKDARDFPAAQSTLEKAWALKDVDWSKPGVGMMLGDAYRFGGKFEKANDTFRAVIALPNANDALKGVAHLNIALTFQYGLKQFDDARREYAEAVKLNPGLKKEVDAHLAKM